MGLLSLALGLNIGTSSSSGGTPTPTPPPVTLVYGPADTIGNAPAGSGNGWAALMTTPSDLAYAPISVSRQGYDNTGTVVPAIPETVLTTKLVNNAATSSSAPSVIGNVVALSTAIYSTDTISGCTINTTDLSPKPSARWSMPHRLLVGNSVTVSVVAFHRNGRLGNPVACVEFSATDGTNSIIPVKVSSLTVTADPLTGNRILEYVAVLDITTLNDNANITVNAKVYPWIGASGSVNDSSANGSTDWQFTARTFRKNTARFAAPYIVLIRSTGTDATGAVDTSTSTAKAACLTWNGAIDRARAVLGTGAGSLDGVEFWFEAGTWARAATPTANTVNCAVVFKPITGVSKASCILQFGAANNNTGMAYNRWTGVTIQRAGIQYLNAVANSVNIVDDCTWDWNGNTSTVMTSTQTANHYLINVAFNASTSGIGISEGTNPSIALVRGCTGGAANTGAGVEMLCCIGNTFYGVTQAAAARLQDGNIIAFNQFLGLGGSGIINFRISIGTTVTGFCLVQNIFESTNATGTSQRSFMPSGDSATVSTIGTIVWHNTFAGFNDYGRNNVFYDETNLTLRTHRLMSSKGNIHCQINTKSDRYCGIVGTVTAPETHTGNWPYNYGVDCDGEFSIFANAQGTTTGGFNQIYPGLNAKIGTSNTGAGQDPLFTTNRAVTSGPVAGAGGGTYTLQVGSPALAIYAASPLGYDLAGNVRTGTVAAGAYA